ncbi:MAG: hypothetical protein WA109_08335 [Bellilinea sp.]
MGDDQEYLRKELKPTKVYLNDLYWIEEKLSDIPIICAMRYSLDDSEYGIYHVSGLLDKAEKMRFNKLDNLEFDGGQYFVQFFSDKTTITFNDIGKVSKSVFLDITKYLEKKQRKCFLSKSIIYLFDKPLEEPFLYQSSIPNWITILVQGLTLIIALLALILK